MIKENILEIKKLVGDMNCMGTYGMVELELTKIENHVKELESKVKTLALPDVNSPLIAALTTKLIDATNEIMKDGVIGDNYTRLDDKIKRISSTLNVINGR